MTRTRKGDVNAYDELYRRHLPDARRVARIVADDRDEAEDVVAEAFTRLLDRLQNGGGPDSELTPYLRTIIRRLAVDRHRASIRDGHPADPELLEVLPTADDEIGRATARQLVREAFETLPERWQRVLWHTEIEGRAATALAPTLGSSPNAVAALAYRAREGLRQAYFAVHLSSQMPEQCKTYLPKLASYIRETLPEPEDVAVAIHLDTCAHCREQRDEMLLLVADVRALLTPALLGTMAVTSGNIVGAAATGAAAASGGAAVYSAGGAAELGAGVTKLARLRPRGVIQVAATSVVSAAAAAAVAFAAVSAMSPAPTADDNVAAPPPATSVYTPATSGTMPAIPPVVEPDEPPEPTAEADDDAGADSDGADDGTSIAPQPPAQQNQHAQPTAESERPRDTGSESAATPPAERGPTSQPSNGGQRRPADSPAPAPAPAPAPVPEPEPEPEPEIPDADVPEPGTQQAGLLCRLFPGAFPWCP